MKYPDDKYWEEARKKVSPKEGENWQDYLDRVACKARELKYGPWSPEQRALMELELEGPPC